MAKLFNILLFLICNIIPVFFFIDGGNLTEYVIAFIAVAIILGASFLQKKPFDYCFIPFIWFTSFLFLYFTLLPLEWLAKHYFKCVDDGVLVCMGFQWPVVIALYAFVAVKYMKKNRSLVSDRILLILLLVGIIALRIMVSYGYNGYNHFR